MLVRNEGGADRYLVRAIKNLQQFCDKTVVLDDNSTDDTVAVCRANGVDVVERIESGDGWWDAGNEGTQRQRLWELASQCAGRDGWVLIADADHELTGITPEEFRALLKADHVNAWACPLYDAWDSDKTHRIDGFWQAWRSPRAWLARAFIQGHSGELAGYSRGVHAGHLPDWPWTVGLMPKGAAILHLGYIQEAHRLVKVERYLALS